MAKQDNKPDTTRSTFHERAARPRPEAPIFDSERDERAWRQEQDKLDAAYAEAFDKFPPGSKLFVTTARGIERRGRAGLAFTAAGRTEVQVVADEDDAAAKVKAGGYFVTPLGAKSIMDDTGLIVFEEKGSTAAANPSEADRRIGELEAENKSLRDQLARARNPRTGGDGRPERLGADKGENKAAGGEFGGEDKSKA